MKHRLQTPMASRQKATNREQYDVLNYPYNFMMKQQFSLLAISLFSVMVCAQGATAQDVSTTTATPQKQELAADYLNVLRDYSARWTQGAGDNAGNENLLSMSRVGQLLESPAVKGREAAALAAIFRHMRSKKMTVVSLDQLQQWAKDLTTLYDSACKRVESGYSLYGASDHPVISEIKQGGLGDCYLISSIDAILSRAPNKIMEMIERGYTPNEFTVHFPGYENAIRIRLTPGEIAALPNSDGDNGIWLPVLVMADSAARNGGEVPDVPYINMAGGHPGKCLHMLTGLEYKHTTLKKCSPQFIRKILTRAEEGNYPVGVNTPSHDCCVIAYNTQTETVTVKNPWGTTGKYRFRNGSEVHMDHGVFPMSIDQLMSCFSGITYPKRIE